MHNQAPNQRTRQLRPAPAALCCLALLCSACGNDPLPEQAAPARPRGGSGVIASDNNPPEPGATSGPPRSVFSVGKGSRDPFFPPATPAPDANPAAASSTQPTQPVDVIGLLQEGLQWVVGSGSQRLALLNNVMLEPNKTSQVPISHNGRREMISVRCVAIQKNTVTLVVPGHSNPVTITQIPKK